jgi:RHS repeat-associated protein
MRHTYDSADRLTKTCFTMTTCATANQTTWSYNRVGSRLSEKVGSAAVSTYTYDVVDQLTAITGPGAATFTYSPNGDQLTAGGDTFTYNTARQTMSATVAGVSSVFAYDGSGNRSSVTTGGLVTSEVWDTQGGLPSLVAQRDAAGVVSRRYTYVGSSPVKFEEGPTAGYYLTDGLGSVSNMTTTTGAVGATYRYSPYGTARAATSVLPAFVNNPMRYTGQQLDATGNYNLRARHYNPNRGTFTQTDPIPYGAGSAFEGAYVYGGARPTVMTDPGGRRFSNAMSFGGNKGAKAPEATCEACDVRASSSPPFLPWFTGHGVSSPGAAEYASFGKMTAGMAGGLLAFKPFAAFMLRHYLNNSGKTVNWDAANHGPNNRAWSHLVQVLESLYSTGHTKMDEDGVILHQFRSTVNNAIKEGGGKVESDWEQFDFYGLGSMNDSRNALGSFFLKTVSNRSPSGKWCTMFYVADRYQFDPRINNGGMFTDQELATLHRTGLAQNFDFLARIDVG